MDRQNRVGHKTGSGAPASAQDVALERKERLRRLAMETIDMSKDPYWQKNHLGGVECKLCLTLHINEANYLSHTQGKKHQTNLARRAQKEKADQAMAPQPAKIAPKSKTVKIGRPGYRVTKLRDPETFQKALLFEIEYPEINDGIKPRYRVMSAYEQRIEEPQANARFQYLLFAADPYETIAFKVPNMDLDRAPGKLHVQWDAEKKTYTLQVFFKERDIQTLPALPQRPTNFQPIGARW
uniref:Matrin-type domain-containing protein n=1 Tax=Chromera velia CCMP2878 TaxID=1169474 RepID=A0A0G4HDR0_9ALVE|mmetsp:Transcript_52851/g.103353  ORF Transcript_52851/g.103353 Transcript_52851/m.103353 type:complete len:239 (-) Transcript_52851:232-948(-)|eukprot:Cvel_6397.t1-p1 / transcript=Cvel_6397.t1 / gene=Cvel_6397 / organism=Chromera_velia_CCMP2878 / gene_product=Splicing factor 3A subunit 2, putative / transcript_product=Splicing factor 3A subunit 2, putative / location=Cvel_scaffold312:64279-67237(+) / protein_length=238 / sequence_SO=supercontig / SO=protein_coding / is_pseudo=false